MRQKQNDEFRDSDPKLERLKEKRRERDLDKEKKFKRESKRHQESD